MFYYRKNKQLHHDSSKTIHFFLMIGYITMLFFMFAGNANAKTLHSEAEYVEHYCKGKVEYRNADKTRTDCLTADFSYEYDFAKKWYECLTQGLYYGMINNNFPACVLIVENKNQMYYVDRARRTIEHYNLKIGLIVVREY